ncbi:MAG: Gfo/Idh/MocA family oxidoreductase [Lentisphaeria bacterium]|nr:Gfo/Idh/MocA family oxidoreductase [Lentisphaeria bacterium]
MNSVPPFSRRSFLKSAPVVLAAPSIVPSVLFGQDGGTAPSNRITVACIGVRNMGSNHFKTLLGNPSVQLLAVCDVDAGLRNDRVTRANAAYAQRLGKADYKGVTGYNDFRDVMARDDIDAAVIAVPDHSHALIALAAMRSGKDVYIEKPMTLTIREGRLMADAVQRYGRVLQCGSQRRSSGTVRRVCELVRNGRIGDLQQVKVGLGSRPRRPQPWKPEPVPEGFDYDLWLGPAPWAPYTTARCHYNFRFLRDYSGGEMTNFGAHYLDVAQWGIGADDGGPVEIEGKGLYHRTGLWDVFYEFELEYTYANGVKVLCSHAGGGCRFFGSDGWVDIDGKGEPGARLRAGIGPNEIHLYEGNGSHMGNFLDCVRTRRQPAAPVEVGHRSATVCHLGNIAMTLGRKLRWDPVREEFPGDEEANRMTWRSYREPWTLN